MIERLMVLVIVSGLAVLVYQTFRRWQVRRVVELAPADPLLAERRPGVPAILYFTTPHCLPCKTQQRPAIQRLLAEMGDTVQVIEINAMEQPDAADRWGVLSVPTTFILDGRGKPREINYGVTGVDKLKHQLMGL
ncbi:MAG: thioredoxin family protein [Chloroflexi bacterium]|nr:thioredoxin family protein [Chloroflexota bacterium]